MMYIINTIILLLCSWLFGKVMTLFTIPMAHEVASQADGDDTFVNSAMFLSIGTE